MAKTENNYDRIGKRPRSGSPITGKRKVRIRVSLKGDQQSLGRGKGPRTHHSKVMKGGEEEDDESEDGSVFEESQKMSK